MPERLFGFRHPRDWKEAFFQLVFGEIILASVFWILAPVIGIHDTVRDIGFVVVFIAAIFAAAWYFKRAPSDQKEPDALAEGDANTESRNSQQPNRQLVFIDPPRVENDPDRNRGVKVVAAAKNNGATDALLCTLRIDSARLSIGAERPLRDSPLK